MSPGGRCPHKLPQRRQSRILSRTFPLSIGHHSRRCVPLYEKPKIVARALPSSSYHHSCHSPDLPLVAQIILFCSAVAKMTASLVTYPHKVVQMRLQTQRRADGSCFSLVRSASFAQWAKIVTRTLRHSLTIGIPVLRSSHGLLRVRDVGSKWCVRGDARRVRAVRRGS